VLLVTGKSAAAAQAIAVVVFALIGFSLVIIPFVFLVVGPAGTEARQQHAQHWLKSHARQILAAVVLHPLQRVGTVVPQARRQGRLLTPSDGTRYAAARGSAISDPLTSRLRWLWR
jgi:hypothetical protein